MSDDPVDRERIALHRSRCPDCRIYAEREEELRRSLDLIGHCGLDDLARERIRARLSGDFDRIASESARPARRSRPWIGLAAAAIVLLALLWPRPRIEEPPPRLDLLAPFLITGTTEAKLGRRASIEAAAGQRVRAVVASKGTVTLVGPGRASMASPDRVVVSAGRLFADVRGPFTLEGGGRMVHVRAGESSRIDLAVIEAQSSAPVQHLAANGVPELSSIELGPPSDPSGVLVISGGPDGAIATLDGVVLGPTPLIARISSGAHSIGIAAGAHPPFQRTIDVADDGVVHVSYDLDPPPPAPAVRPAPKAIRPPAPEPAPAETADDVYRRAEAALAEGREDDARSILEDLIARFAGDPLADMAYYELARIAYDRGELASAHASLIRLLERRPEPNVAESGLRLLCRIDLETERYDAADTCWRSFLERHPSSVHAPEALASQIALALHFRDCPRVHALAAALEAAHPGHALLPDAKARVAQCTE
jgi:hypothetical protein